MIFNGFFDSCALVFQDRKGKAASWARKLRRAIVFTPELWNYRKERANCTPLFDC
jgi:hypothetical protein